MEPVELKLHLIMTHIVSDEYRSNELSLTPGGTVLTIHYKNGKKLTYDKIKNIKAYLSKVTLDPNVIKIWQEDVLVWERKA